MSASAKRGGGGGVAVHDKPPVTDEKRFKGLLKASSTKTLGPGKAPPTVLETLEEEENARAIAKASNVVPAIISLFPAIIIGIWVIGMLLG